MELLQLQGWLVVASFFMAFGFVKPAQKKGKYMSIDKQIMDAAPNAHMFDVFHVMPEGDVKVMTELDLLLSLDQYKKLRGTRPRSGASSDDDEASGKVKKKRSRVSRRNNRWRQKRKADQDESLLWPNCEVFYEIDSSFSPEDVTNLQSAIDEWEEYTCLSFYQSTTQTSRIQFKNGGGCYSQLGRQEEPQIIALAPSCRTKGIIAHEIGHAIGWYHEHMRPDRDSYISINFEAIPMRYQINFQKYTTDMIDTHNVDYDYTSLMHYGTDALPGSIITLDPSYQDRIGQREGLSFKDIKLANKMYDCANTMGCSFEECPFGGFQFYKAYKNAGSCECWCDSGDVTDPLVLCSELDSEPPKPVIRPTETPVVDLCYDVRNDCEPMKNQGHCMSKLDLMMDACKKTCGFCDSDGGPEPCMDHDKGCPMMAATGLCVSLEPVMSRQCPGSCNLCPAPPDPCQIQKEIMIQFDHIPNGALRLTTTSVFIEMIILIMVSLAIVILRRY